MSVLLPLTLESGLEALTIMERLKLKTKEISLWIDNDTVSFLGRSIHTVRTYNVFKELKDKNNYFDSSIKQIPVSVFFNPELCTFKQYIETCLACIELLKVTSIDLADGYNILKKAARGNRIPFSIRASKHTAIYDDAKLKFERCIHNTGESHRPLNTVYSSFGEAEDNIHFFNQSVAALKSRDGELIKKQVDNYLIILKLLKDKADVNDVAISDEEGKTIDIFTTRINDSLSLGGKLLGLLNELSRTLELQIDAFRIMAK